MTTDWIYILPLLFRLMAATGVQRVFANYGQPVIKGHKDYLFLKQASADSGRRERCLPPRRWRRVTGPRNLIAWSRSNVFIASLSCFISLQYTSHIILPSIISVLLWQINSLLQIKRKKKRGMAVSLQCVKNTTNYF